MIHFFIKRHYFANLFGEDILKMIMLSPGGEAHWISHLPQEQKTLVRIPPGYKVFRENICSNAVVDLECTYCLCEYYRSR
jgi:hypothetical protein